MSERIGGTFAMLAPEQPGDRMALLRQTLIDSVWHQEWINFYLEQIIERTGS